MIIAPSLPVDDLRQLATKTEELALLVRQGKIAEALRFWHALSDNYEAFDKQRKRINAVIEALSRGTLPEMMGEEGVKTVTLEDVGYRFTVSQRFSCSMPDKEAGMGWLRSNNLGDLIQETVNAQTLASAMKRLIEEEGREPPPELFNTSYMAYTSATKAR
jgi:hypothetical protein